MKRYFPAVILYLLIGLSMQAQIGYQVSLLNNATGEARANEQVTVTVKITDSAGRTICEETKTETSNDFGVVSMSVGNSETFANADWSKLPFFIEASVDGHLLGRSQLLSVPIAEHANHTGTLTKEILCSKTWVHRYASGSREAFAFSENGEYKYTEQTERGTYIKTGEYFYEGNVIFLYDHDDYYEFFYYSNFKNCIISGENGRPFE